MILANANLHRTLVDQESSADILFKLAFDKSGLEEKEWRAYSDNLFGLGDTPIRSLGFISLHTTFGKCMKSRTLSIDYIVVGVTSTYNASIGRTTLNRLCTVVSTPHICMKYSTVERIATIKRDQKLARKCYNESLNLKGSIKGKEVNTIEFGGIRTREELHPQLEGKIKKVQIGDQAKKTTSIGGNLDEKLKANLVCTLTTKLRPLAWKASDMPGIHPDLMCHKLTVYPDSRFVQQKRWKLGLERTQGDDKVGAVGRIGVGLVRKGYE
ncbi:uncharacterized protein [Arachis hypogaea]|uniref:uncharacterized protein n=1 Tax=Arachis hypogaea TaxID=3818 RepID=UPI000DEDAEBD|nr:uncharacterized protein LOC112777993 [Arachis hypogaea]